MVAARIIQIGVERITKKSCLRGKFRRKLEMKNNYCATHSLSIRLQAARSARNLILVIGLLLAAATVSAIICPGWFLYHTSCGQPQDPPPCDDPCCPPG